MSLITFGIAVAIYFSLHSLLAAEGVRSFLIKSLVPEKYFRLFFNVVAIVSLGALVSLFLSLEQQPVLESAMYLTVPGIGFVLAGIVWIIRALIGYGISEFAGMEQLKSGSSNKPIQLKTKGLNSRVRHPLYFGTLMVFWGLFLVFPSDVVLLFAAITTVYIYIGSVLEERKLTQQFGDAYRLYQDNVPGLIPFGFSRKK